ncbi:MAG: hypothetical protein HRT44_00470 [Bdellovibrionales bacterium]|nr:hypothetical protein [Bdellovibrionales bacterium]
MKRSSLLLLSLTLAVAGCSTAAEVLSPNDSPFGYSKKNDGSGKYVRTRKINSPRPQGYVDSISPIYTGDEHHHYHRPQNDSSDDVVSSLVGLAVSESIKSARSSTYNYSSSTYEPAKLGIGLSTAVLEGGGASQV